MYLVNALVPDDSRIAISGQRRDGGQSELAIDFVSRLRSPVSTLWLMASRSSLVRQRILCPAKSFIEGGHDVSELALLVGRLLFGGLFVYNGLNHFLNRAAITGYCAYKGVPAPSAAALLSGVWLLVSGLSIVLGVRPHVGASMIAIFLLAVTPVMHNFWTISDDTQRLGEFINFSKNLALLGAALMALAIPSPWPYSLVP